MIVGPVVYLGLAVWEYHSASAEYDGLRQQVFAMRVQEKDSDRDNGNETKDGDGLGRGAGTEGENVIEDAYNVGDQMTGENWKQSAQIMCAAVGRLQEQYRQVCGWIEFDRLEISYPVMQGEDNEKYLTHTYSGKKNAAGSIFLDACNTPGLTDQYTIFYGHNMKNGSMFGKLRRYRDQDFYQENSFFTVYTGSDACRYQIFSCCEVPESSDIYQVCFLTEEEYDRLLIDFSQQSLYDTGVTADTGDLVLALSTCSTEGSRLVVIAKLVERLENVR